MLVFRFQNAPLPTLRRRASIRLITFAGSRSRWDLDLSPCCIFFSSSLTTLSYRSSNSLGSKPRFLYRRGFCIDSVRRQFQHVLRDLLVRNVLEVGAEGRAKVLRADRARLLWSSYDEHRSDIGDVTPDAGLVLSLLAKKLLLKPDRNATFLAKGRGVC